jgi:hypothetical protein
LKEGRKYLAIQSNAGKVMAAMAMKIRIGPYWLSIILAPLSSVTHHSTCIGPEIQEDAEKDFLGLHSERSCQQFVHIPIADLVIYLQA